MKFSKITVITACLCCCWWFSAVRQLVLIGVHTDPDDAVEEMEALVDVHSAVKRRWNTDDILIMGDLNADCKYASGRARRRLRLRTDRRFTWLIGDDVDTTTTSTDCTYDRWVLMTRPNSMLKIQKRTFELYAAAACRKASKPLEWPPGRRDISRIIDHISSSPQDTPVQ